MSFKAAYNGECGYGDKIYEGDLVMYDADKELVHVTCDLVAQETDRASSTRVCQECFMIHAGECL